MRDADKKKHHDGKEINLVINLIQVIKINLTVCIFLPSYYNIPHI